MEKHHGDCRGFHVEYSMEFSWNSMEFNGVSLKFHGVFHMEFHGISIEIFTCKILHGIPWSIKTGRYSAGLL